MNLHLFLTETIDDALCYEEIHDSTTSASPVLLR